MKIKKVAIYLTIFLFVSPVFAATKTITLFVSIPAQSVDQQMQISSLDITSSTIAITNYGIPDPINYPSTRSALYVTHTFDIDSGSKGTLNIAPFIVAIGNHLLHATDFSPSYASLAVNNGAIQSFRSTAVVFDTGGMASCQFSGQDQAMFLSCVDIKPPSLK